MSKEFIIKSLRDRITRHELPPGGKLLETDLAKEFKVSRAKVRDVLSVLQQRGLVRRIPNRGAVVETLGLTQIAHIYAVREVVEGLGARLAAQNMPPESWQDLVTLFGQPMEDDVHQGNFDAYVQKLELLRERILTAANNPVLTDIVENIQDRARMIMRRIVILPGRAETGLKEHRAVLQALQAGDPDAAEACTRANIRSGMAFLRRYQTFLL